MVTEDEIREFAQYVSARSEDISRLLDQFGPTGLDFRVLRDLQDLHDRAQEILRRKKDAKTN